MGVANISDDVRWVCPIIPLGFCTQWEGSMCIKSYVGNEYGSHMTQSCHYDVKYSIFGILIFS